VPERVSPDIAADPGSDPGFALPAGSNQYKGPSVVQASRRLARQAPDEVRKQCRDYC
jgi:hypothetical protein